MYAFMAPKQGHIIFSFLFDILENISDLISEAFPYIEI